MNRRSRAASPPVRARFAGPRFLVRDFSGEDMMIMSTDGQDSEGPYDCSMCNRASGFPGLTSAISPLMVPIFRHVDLLS